MEATEPVLRGGGKPRPAARPEVRVHRAFTAETVDPLGSPGLWSDFLPAPSLFPCHRALPTSCCHRSRGLLRRIGRCAGPTAFSSRRPWPWPPPHHLERPSFLPGQRALAFLGSRAPGLRPPGLAPSRHCGFSAPSLPHWLQAVGRMTVCVRERMQASVHPSPWFLTRVTCWVAVSLWLRPPLSSPPQPWLRPSTPPGLRRVGGRGWPGW